MTENQRDYLADLAGRKGVRLFDTDNWSVAKASEEIEELKTLPDAAFDDPTLNEDQEIDTRITATVAELNKWHFTRRTE